MSGRVLATDTPAELIKARGAATLEDAFIGYLEEANGAPRRAAGRASRPLRRSRTRLRRDWTTARPRRRSAFAGSLLTRIRETLELLRDPIRLVFALLGTAFLMLVFGFGITTDVNNLSFAALDRDQTPESRAYLSEFRGSRYFVERPPIIDYADLERRLRSGDVKATIEIPPGFGRDLKKGTPVAVGAWVDGAMPFRAETIRGYLQGVHQQYLADPVLTATKAPAAGPTAIIETRFGYNQNFKSVYAMVPSTLALLLVLIPAILMALAIVREKELGSITNLYVTPVTRIEFLIGKQLPYIARGHGQFRCDVADGAVCFRRAAEGQLPDARTRGAALRHDDDRLRHADIVVCQHADRRAVRHRDPDIAAGDAVLRHADPGLLLSGPGAIMGTASR